MSRTTDAGILEISHSRTFPHGTSQSTGGSSMTSPSGTSQSTGGSSV